MFGALSAWQNQLVVDEELSLLECLQQLVQLFCKLIRHGRRDRGSGCVAVACIFATALFNSV